MFDPWQAAAEQQLRIYLTDLGELSGVTDGEHVWLSPDLTWVEARCTLAHELEHITAGHVGHQPPAVERWVRVRVARRLIPLERLLGHRESQEHPATIAETLDVTLGVLRDRIRGLTLDERARLYRREREGPPAARHAAPRSPGPVMLDLETS